MKGRAALVIACIDRRGGHQGIREREEEVGHVVSALGGVVKGCVPERVAAGEQLAELVSPAFLALVEERLDRPHVALLHQIVERAIHR